MTSLLEISGLNLNVRVEGTTHPILRDVSLHVERSEVVAIVGETGSGKTMTAKTVMGLLPKNAIIESGRVAFDGRDMLERGEASATRKKIAMVFQNPMSSINPLFRVGDQMSDVLRWASDGKAPPGEERKDRMRRALEDARCYEGGRILEMYPFQLSGGMRQRVMIAMALLRDPELMIADEPTTALDVTTQREILDLLLELSKKSRMSLMLITHNLGIAHESSMRTYVMYAGRVVEDGETSKVFTGPLHPYTQGLVDSIPSLDRSRSMGSIQGEISQQDREIAACCFSSRCPYVMDRCRVERPALKELRLGQRVACFVAEDKVKG
ncbi:MAG: ABC transporter ATP-binding protein [Nitrososphaerota archaeon]|nr:ABC transporter ATP-binding protein [Nitrososphaerota archaeon]